MIVIANPPYGSHGNLAKKIIEQIPKYCEQASILSIAQGFESIYQYASSVSLNDQQAFSDMWIPTITAHFNFTKINDFKSLDDFRLATDPKKVQWQKAVEKYNSTHVSNIEYLGRLTSAENIKRFRGKSQAGIFTMSFYAASPHHLIPSPIKRTAEECRYNFGIEEIDWNKPSSLNAVYIKDKKQFEGFRNFWYGYNQRENGWESIADQRGTLLSFILDCAYTIGGTTPNLKKYEPFIPNVDWSHPWTDDELKREVLGK